jgi:hypothetical protein
MDGMTILQKEVAKYIGIDRLRASTDPYFNDIPLREWDKLADGLNNSSLGSFYFRGGSLSQRVCLLKDAARSLIGGTPKAH